MPDQDKTRTPLRKLGPSRKVRAQAQGRRGPNPAVRTGRWVIGHPWSILGVAAAVWLAVWVVNSRSEPHHIKVAFPTAFNLTPGLDVAVDGLDAGKISKVDFKDGRAVVELGIDDKYWPIPQGTIATSRYGTTIGSGTRRVDLALGPDSAKKIPENGIIASKDTRPAVDVDSVLNTANAATRKDATSLAKNTDRALSGSEDDANSSLAATPQGLKDVDGFLKDLGSDSVALSGLITNTDRLTQVLAARSGQVANLVTVSARTFGAFADRSDELKATLDAVPPAAETFTSSLGKFDHSIIGLTQLVDDIRPGAKRLRPLATSALPALKNLSSIVPAALSTVRTTTKVAPQLNTLLTNGTPFVGKVQRVTHELEPMMHCLRPYAPDAVNALGNLGSWVAGYVLEPDEKTGNYSDLQDAPFPYHGRKEGNYYRQHALAARPQVSTATLHSDPLSPAAYIALSGKKYAYPRATGLTLGKPQWMPECHITKDSLDPTKDPEVQR